MWCGIFSGQGSQFPGMGKFLYDNFKLVKEFYEEASDVLSLDMRKLCHEGDDKELALTENTQPALLLQSHSLFQVLKSETQWSPNYLAGHSIGEYAACVSAEALSFADTVKAVRCRGEFMQSAVPVGQGGMMAVLGLTNEQVATMCEWGEKESSHSPLEPANFNSPGQVVISGNQKGLEWLSDNVKKENFSPPPRRMKLIPLKVSAPFHCSLMKPAQEKMALVLRETKFTSAKIPVVQNVTATPVSEADLLRENLVQQVSSPVRWSESLMKMDELGCDSFIEFGPGKVLSGLVKKTLPHATSYNVNSLEELQDLLKKV